MELDLRVLRGRSGLLQRGARDRARRVLALQPGAHRGRQGRCRCLAWIGLHLVAAAGARYGARAQGDQRRLQVLGLDLHHRLAAEVGLHLDLAGRGDEMGDAVHQHRRLVLAGQSQHLIRHRRDVCVHRRDLHVVADHIGRCHRGTGVRCRLRQAAHYPDLIGRIARVRRIDGADHVHHVGIQVDGEQLRAEVALQRAGDALQLTAEVDPGRWPIADSGSHLAGSARYRNSIGSRPRTRRRETRSPGLGSA